MREAAQSEALADRIFVGEICLRKRLVDYGDVHRVRSISLVEPAASQDVRADGIEKARADSVPGWRNSLLRPIFERGAHLPVVARHRAVEHERGVAYARNLPRAPFDLAVNGSDLLRRVSGYGGIHVDHDVALHPKSE